MADEKLYLDEQGLTLYDKLIRSFVQGLLQKYLAKKQDKLGVNPSETTDTLNSITIDNINYKVRNDIETKVDDVKVDNISVVTDKIANIDLTGKVDKEDGKGLSTNDFTTDEKDKLSGITEGATKVESSSTNGKIQINGTDTKVYELPSDIVPVSANPVVTYGTLNSLTIDGTAYEIGGTGTITDVKKNGTSVVINGVANVAVPTKTSELTNDDYVVKDANYIHTDINFTNTYKNRIDALTDDYIKSLITNGDEVSY